MFLKTCAVFTLIAFCVIKFLQSLETWLTSASDSGWRPRGVNCLERRALNQNSWFIAEPSLCQVHGPWLLSAEFSPEMFHKIFSDRCSIPSPMVFGARWARDVWMLFSFKLHRLQTRQIFPPKSWTPKKKNQMRNLSGGNDGQNIQVLWIFFPSVLFTVNSGINY